MDLVHLLCSAGPERRSAVIEQHNKEIVAYHEGGHALVALYTPGEQVLGVWGGEVVLALVYVCDCFWGVHCAGGVLTCLSKSSPRCSAHPQSHHCPTRKCTWNGVLCVYVWVCECGCGCHLFIVFLSHEFVFLCATCVHGTPARV